MGITRLNQLPEGSGTLSSDDIFMFMDDPSGGGTTKKISLSQISTAIGAGGVDLGNYFNTSIIAGSGLEFNYNSGNNTLAINSSGIVSNTNLVPNSSGITNIVSISQANYNAIATKDPSTLYVIS